MHRLIYFVLKLRIHFLGKHKLKKYKISDNSYFLKKTNNNEINRMLIYLNNDFLAHMGDQIFFEPLMQFLKKNKINFDICVTKNMRGYFNSLEYINVEEPIFKNYDLIISRSDFYYDLKGKGNIFLIQTTNLKEKICNTIINEVSKFLKKELVNNLKISKYKNIENDNIYLDKIKNDINNKYIIFSNYIDSGSMFYNGKNKKRLEEFCKKYCSENRLKVIHVGTKKDKERDKKSYSFVDIDLRGKTNIKNIYYLVSLENIVEYVGMDNFIMHLFFIYNKPTNICIRNKGCKKRREDIIKFVNPPFATENKYKIFYIN